MNSFLTRAAARLGFEDALQRYWHHVPRMGRVLMVGGVGFIIQTAIFEIFGIWNHIFSPSTATIIGAECAILINFYLNERFSFREAAYRRRPLYSRLGRFHLVCCMSLASQWTCVHIAEGMSKSALVLNGAYLLGVGFGFVFNYAGYYLYVWRRHGAGDIV